jgi:hypothetical protein
MDTEGLPPPKQSIGGRRTIPPPPLPPTSIPRPQSTSEDSRPSRNTDIPEGMVHVFKQVPTQATFEVKAREAARTVGSSDNSGHGSFGILKLAQPSTNRPIKVQKKFQKKVQKQTNHQRLPRYTAEPSEQSGPGVFGVLLPTPPSIDRPSMEPRDDTGTT